MRVCDLSGGDVVRLLDREAVFIGRSQHRVHPQLELVVWRLETGEVSLDALRADQEGGGLGIETLSGPDEQIDKAIAMLSEPDECWELSHRNRVPLAIASVDRP